MVGYFVRLDAVGIILGDYRVEHCSSPRPKFSAGTRMKQRHVTVQVERAWDLFLLWEAA